MMRRLSIDITMAQNNDYGAALTTAKQAGAGITSVSLAWDNIAAGRRDASKPDFLAIANAAYPPQKIDVTLILAVLDTNAKRVPPELASKPFDAPEMIASFKETLDFVFARIPQLSLTCLAIGNEIDHYLGKEASLWAQYTAFFAEAAAYARRKRPGVKVGAKMTFDGLTGASARFAETLNRSANVVMATYYPAKTAATLKTPAETRQDLTQMADVARKAKKPLYLLECGCPSGALCGSSEAKQAEFVRTIFAAWDREQAAMPLISFTWLTDIPAPDVERFQKYYGVSAPAFADYLATLGLRTWAGKGQDKAAFIALKAEAKRRGLR